MQTVIDQLDSMIREGRGQDAIEIVKKMRPSDFSNAQKHLISAICQRLQLSILAIRFLKPVIRDHIDQKLEATPEQIIIYTRPLIRLGFYFEAENWIKNLDSTKHPEVNELLSRIAMAQWDHQKSVFYLKKYRNNISSKTYSFKISSLNFASSLIGYGKEEEAFELLTELISDKSNNQSSSLVLGNARELLAQACLKMGRYEEASQHLTEGGKLLGHSQEKFRFLIEKWRFARDLKLTSDTKVLAEKRLQLCKSAVDMQFWEGHREIDKLWAVYSQDVNLAKQLYFGTIHEVYRKQIKSEIEFPLEKHYDRILGESANEEAWSIDLSQNLKPGSHLYNLFNCLNRDFYRPLPMGYLFSQIYQGEYFDPDSSPRRLYRLVDRLNTVFSKSIPFLKCTWNNHSGSLTSEKKISIKVDTERKTKSKRNLEIAKMRSSLGQSWFSSEQVCSLLGVKKRKAQLLILESREQFSVETQGKGPATRYRFCG